MTRLKLIEAGVLREGPLLSPLLADGGGLRLDAAGRAAAARHLRAGDFGRRLMPPPGRSLEDLAAIAALERRQKHGKFRGVAGGGENGRA